ncbi:unnamed protein product [Urochloa humidicola]
MAQQLSCVSAARPLLAVPAGWGPGPWRGGAVGRGNAAGSAMRGAAVGLRASVGAAAQPVASVAVVDEEEEEDAEVEERYALGNACKVLAGMPAPLGATALDGGVNFAVYSAGASAASLCLRSTISRR